MVSGAGGHDDGTGSWPELMTRLHNYESTRMVWIHPTLNRDTTSGHHQIRGTYVTVSHPFIFVLMIHSHKYGIFYTEINAIQTHLYSATIALLPLLSDAIATNGRIKRLIRFIQQARVQVLLKRLLQVLETAHWPHRRGQGAEIVSYIVIYYYYYYYYC